MIARVLRRLRAGPPIVIVSGLPRSGTSLAMRMLAEGGMPVLTDGVRSADVSNPNGYYEFERVKGLEQLRDTAWLAGARGKAVKVISFLLTWLPEDYDYRIIFMERPLDEVLASQDAMLAQRGEASVSRAAVESRAMYEGHLRQLDGFLARRACFSVLRLNYRDVVARPAEAAARIAAFVQRPLDQARMVAVVNPALYRNRHHASARS